MPNLNVGLCAVLLTMFVSSASAVYTGTISSCTSVLGTYSTGHGIANCASAELRSFMGNQFYTCIQCASGHGLYKSYEYSPKVTNGTTCDNDYENQYRCSQNCTLQDDPDSDYGEVYGDDVTIPNCDWAWASVVTHPMYGKVKYQSCESCDAGYRNVSRTVDFFTDLGYFSSDEVCSNYVIQGYCELIPESEKECQTSDDCPSFGDITYVSDDGSWVTGASGGYCTGEYKCEFDYSNEDYCNIGYYGYGYDCTRCPAIGGVYGTTADYGSYSVERCFFPKDTVFTDGIGTGVYVDDCYASNTD